MPIAVKCSECESAFRVKDELSGRAVRCPKCKHPIRIPSLKPKSETEDTASSRTAPSSEQRRTATGTPLANSALPTKLATPLANKTAAKPGGEQLNEQARTQLQARIMAGFTDEIDRVRAPLSYRLGVLLATFVMVLLPVIYIALIILTGWGVYYHLANHAGMLKYGYGRTRAFVFLLYVAPLFAGVTMVLFMTKPLFARPATGGRKRSITKDGEPILFAFVERVCDIVGAPFPKRIDVDCEVNASASFRRGWLSMLTGRDLVLTIGMPLVAGFNMRQFAGVLAHEFGHFSQGAGMRLTFIVRTISFWFTRDCELNVGTIRSDVAFFFDVVRQFI